MVVVVQVVQRGSESHDRTIHHLFGPRVVFNAGGKIGTLQWNYVLIQLTAALALFGVSTTFIDFIMCYLSSKVPPLPTRNPRQYTEGWCTHRGCLTSLCLCLLLHL